jgi:hypothetical protein
VVANGLVYSAAGDDILALDAATGEWLVCSGCECTLQHVNGVCAVGVSAHCNM